MTANNQRSSDGNVSAAGLFLIGLNWRNWRELATRTYWVSREEVISIFSEMQAYELDKMTGYFNDSDKIDWQV